MNDNLTKIGVGIMILKDNSILLGKRKNSHGDGEYAFPGGHLEYMETFQECAVREILEETGLEIHNLKFQFIANVKEYAPKHYVHIGLVADWQSGIPEVREPDKVEKWDFYELDRLPKPLFKFCQVAIESYQNKVVYFDGI